MTDQGPTFRNLLDGSSSHGEQRFRFRGEEVWHLCLHCDVAFPQDDEGWKAKREHEFREHSQADLFGWHELHGQTLQIAVVEVEGEDGYLGQKRTIDVYGKAEDGIVYHLHTAETQGRVYDGELGLKDWKWANTKHLPQLNSPKAMRREAESLSNGSESTGAR